MGPPNYVTRWELNGNQGTFEMANPTADMIDAMSYSVLNRVPVQLPGVLPAIDVYMLEFTYNIFNYPDSLREELAVGVFVIDEP